MALPELESARLLLRPRQLADLDAVVRMNADPQVMRHIAAVDDPAMRRDAVAARSFSHIGRGLGYWSVFAKAEPAEFTGYVGLIPDGGALDDIQLSYRFEVQRWGKGYAREACTRLLGHAFSTLGFPQIGVTTHPLNLASLRLAERLGFEAAPTDPDILIGEPQVPAARLLLTRSAWLSLTQPEA
ncbi:GNAT family N-acetyltransferase [Bosea sp. F3-2]|jgi:RimJ/RimL family protein N-acetyltransferase|uniref:GNAT family N-acetyltransferase n=1 Tax=Bosea sp. F3-2 TaxID=2599640 RepID=UPI0011EBB6A7|nr:GNAT family N-acetyltransferase [Bosea sp. F3-2]QEL22776.1 GNAT family N-acetyltransferase [Bosea sp. F3-2]